MTFGWVSYIIGLSAAWYAFGVSFWWIIAVGFDTLN